MRTTVAIFSIVAATLTPTGTVRADDAVDDNVVVTKSVGNAVVIWDATTTVAQMLAKKKADDVMSSALEVDAAKILLKKASDLPRAEEIRVKVVFQRMGALSDEYKIATLMGVERLLNVSAPRSQALAHSTEWSSDLERGALPAGIKATVTGSFEPNSP